MFSTFRSTRVFSRLFSVVTSEILNESFLSFSLAETKENGLFKIYGAFSCTFLQTLSTLGKVHYIFLFAAIDLLFELLKLSLSFG